MRRLLWIALGLSACNFEVGAPADAQIECLVNDECPVGQACNQLTARCVDELVLKEEPPGLAGTPAVSPASGDFATVFTAIITLDGAPGEDPTVVVQTPAGDRLFTLDETNTDRQAFRYELDWDPSTTDPLGTFPIVAAWRAESGVAAEPVEIGRITLTTDDNTPPAPAPPLLAVSLAPESGGYDTTFAVDLALEGPAGTDPTVKVAIDGVDRFFEVDEANTNRAVSQWRFVFNPTTADAEGTWPVVAEWTSVDLSDALGQSVGALTIDASGPIVDVQLNVGVIGRGGSASISVVTNEALPSPPALIFAQGNDPGFVLESSADTLHVFTVDVTCSAISCDPPDDSYVLEAVDVADALGNVRRVAVEQALLVDTTAPTIQQLTVNRARFSEIAPFDEVSVTFSTDEVVDDATILATLGTLSLACSPRAPTRPHYTCTGTVAIGDIAEGDSAVLVTARDAAGNAGAASRPVVVDFTPPSILPDSIAFILEAAPTSLVQSPAFATPGVTVRLTFSVDEALLAAPLILGVPAPFDPQLPPIVELPFEARQLIGARIVEQTLLFDDFTIADGDYTAIAALEDEVGHVARVDVLSGSPIPFVGVVESPCIATPAGVAVCTDFDGDGQVGASSACPGSNDCDDSNPLVRVGGVEIPGNRLDDDCVDGDLDLDDPRNFFVDPNAAVSGPGTRDAPARNIGFPDGRNVLIAVGVLNQSATIDDAAMVGGLDPVTWLSRPGERTRFENASITVDGRSAVVGVDASFNLTFCEQAFLVDVVTGFNSVRCPAIAIASELGHLQIESTTFSAIDSSLISFDAFGSSLRMHRSRLSADFNSTNLSGGSLLVTSSIFDVTLLTLNNADARFLYSNLDFNTFSSVTVANTTLAIMGSRVLADTAVLFDLQNGSRVRIVSVAFGGGDRTQIESTSPTRFARASAYPQECTSCDAAAGVDFFVDHGTLDGVHLGPTSPLLGLGPDLFDEDTSIAGDIDGDCRQIPADIGADER